MRTGEPHSADARGNAKGLLPANPGKEESEMLSSAGSTSPTPGRHSTLAELTTQIVTTYLERSGSAVNSIDDLNALIETTYSTLLKYESQRYEVTGAMVSELPDDPAMASRLSEFTGGDPAVASEAIENEVSKPLGQADEHRKPSKLKLPSFERIRSELRNRKGASFAVPIVGQTGTPVEFDTEEWLASFSNPSDVMIAEARADNTNNKRGWIGVYDDGIVCLFTGRRVKVLGPHLRRLFRDDKTFKEFSSHAGYVHGLRLPIDYPKAAPYLSTIRTNVAAQRGKSEAGRPADIQAKIDKILANTDFDLSLRDKPATRPGNFPDFVVCLECGDAVHDIRPHLRAKHKTFYDRYKRDWHISGRAPATGEGGMNFTSTRRHAAEMLEKMGIPASEQVKPDKWPGVLKDKILCMIDGQLVDDLAKHLASNGHPPVAHYRARFELPANYPATPSQRR